MEEGTSTSDTKKDIIDDDKEKDNKSNQADDDEFNPTLAAMEMEIKPKVLKTILNLCKDYSKLIKYQKEKLDSVLKSEIFSPAKEKSYLRIVNNILENNIKNSSEKKKKEKLRGLQQNFIPSESKIILGNNSDGGWYFDNESILSIGKNDFQRKVTTRNSGSLIRKSYRILFLTPFCNQNCILCFSDSGLIKW